MCLLPLWLGSFQNIMSSVHLFIKQPCIATCQAQFSAVLDSKVNKINFCPLRTYILVEVDVQ